MPVIPEYGNTLNANGLGRVVEGGSLDNAVVRAALDTEGASGRIDVVTFTAPGNDATFSVDFIAAGVNKTVSITTDGTATATEAATALVAAIEADVLLSGKLKSVESAAGVVTITWWESGTVALNANPGTAMALTTTAATSHPQYFYGYAVEFVDTTSSVDHLTYDGIQRPSGSGTEFGIVGDDYATAPEGVEAVNGPRPGHAVKVVCLDGHTRIRVATGSASISRGDAVYVGSSGAEKGLLYTSTGSGRVLWGGASFVRLESAGIAIVQL